MKLAVLLAGALSAVSSVQTFAADFRVLDFAASCDDIASLEARQGVRPFGGKLPSGYQLAFVTRDMNRDVVVGYACKDGKFYRGAYIFEAADGDDATQIYTALKQRVTSQLGAPYFDFASPEYRRKLEALGATLSRADTQVAFWRAQDSEAHASVAEPSGDRGWRVSLSYTAGSEIQE